MRGSGTGGRHPAARRLLIAAAGILAAGAAAAAVYFSLARPVQPEYTFSAAVDFPGRADGGMTMASDASADDMRSAVSTLLLRGGLLAESCRIPGGTWKKTLEVSGRFLFRDQAELLDYYAEQGDRRKFDALYKLISRTFRNDDGFYVREAATADGDVSGVTDSGISAGDNLRYCRVLLEGYSKFRNGSYLASAGQLADLLYPQCAVYGILPPDTEIVVSQTTPTPDFSATPTPKPTASPSAGPDGTVKAKVVDLAGVDLYALRLLGELDSRWAPVYASSLAAVNGALLDAPAPLFRAGYYADGSGYAPYLGAAPVFDFGAQIRIALRLAEVGELEESTYSWLKQVLLNDRAFYQTYDILTASVVPSPESVAGYACMARIARMRGDPAVYAFCAGRIFWNSADSPTSRIFGLPFIETDDGTILVYAEDAVLSLKAFY